MKALSRSWLAAGLLVLLGPAGPLAAASILIYRSPSDGGYGDNRQAEINALLSAGNSVTTVTVPNAAFCPGETWTNYDQVWDFRFVNLAQSCPSAASSDNFSACWRSKATNYLENCGRLYLLGENSGFANRNEGLGTFLNGLGATTSYSGCADWGATQNWNMEWDSGVPPP